MRTLKRLVASTYFHLLLIVFIGAILMWPGIGKVFEGTHDFNGVEYGNFARNYVRFGLIKTKLGELSRSGPTLPLAAPSYNTHHLPLLPLVMAGSYVFLGISEFSSRLPIMLISLGTLVMVYLLGKAIKDKWLGLTAALFASVTPLLRYYGKMPVHEPILTFELTLLLYFFIRYVRTRENKFFAGCVITTTMIGFTGWPGYFFVPGLIVFSLIFVKQMPKKVWWLPVVLVATFSLHLLHVHYLTGSFTGGGLVEVLKLRLNMSDSNTAKDIGFSWHNYQHRLKGMLPQLYSPQLILLTELWLGILVLALLMGNVTGKRYFSQSLWIVAVIFVSLGYPLVFAEAVYIHEYLIMYSLPFFALGGAYAILILDEWLDLHHMGLALIVAVVLVSVLQDPSSHFTTLLKSNNHVPQIAYGQEIKAETQFTDNVLLCEPFTLDQYLYFYADRNLEKTNCASTNGKKVRQFDEQRFEWVVVIKNSNKGLEINLADRYPLIQTNDLLFFDLKHPLTIR